MHKALLTLGLFSALTTLAAQAATAATPLALLHATAVGYTLPLSGTVTITPSVTSLVADNTTPVTLAVKLQDTGGAPIAHQALTVAVSGSTNHLGTSTGVTDVSGNFSTTLKSSQAAIKLITVKANNLSGFAAVTFLPGPPNTRQSMFTVYPTSSQPADGNTSFVLTTLLRDNFANPVPGYALAPASDTAGAVFTPASGTTGQDGTFLTKLTCSKAGKQKLTLNVGGATMVNQATFNGAQPNTLLSHITLSPNTTMHADGNDAFTFTMLLADDNNNPIANYPVVLSSNGTAVTFTTTEGVTTSAGTFTSLVRSKFVGTSSVGYRAGPLTGSQTANFVVGIPKSTTSSMVAVPATLTANNINSTTITAFVGDASGNPVPNQSLAFTISGTGNTAANTNCLTDPNGMCSMSMRSTFAETKKITLSGGAFSVKGSVVFVAGAPDANQSTLTANTNTTLVADDSSAFALSTKLVDFYGNPVGGAQVSMSSSVVSDTFKNTTGITNVKGIFLSLMRASTVGPRTATAMNGNLPLQANVTFGIGPMNAAASVFVGSPSTSIVADGVTTSTLTAQLRDAQGRPLPAQSVTVTASGSNNFFSTTSPVSDSNGNLSFTFKSTRAERKKLTLLAGSSNIYTTLVFVAGSPNQAMSTLTSTPSTPVAALKGGAQIKASVLDAFSNPCTNVPVTFMATGSNNTFTPNGGSTNAVGGYLSTLSTTVAEPKTITASVGGFSLTKTIAFAAAAPSNATSTFSASPTSGIPADGASSTTINAATSDAFGNVTPGQTVYVITSDAHVKAAKKVGITDASGGFTTTLTSTSGGTKTISVQIGGVSKSVSVTFTPVATAAVMVPPAPSQPWDWPPATHEAGQLALAARPIRAHEMTQPMAVHMAHDVSAQVVTANPDEPWLTIYTHDDGNSFAPRARIALEEAPEKLLAADVNGDGLSDLIVVSHGSLTVLLGEPDLAYGAPGPSFTVPALIAPHDIRVVDANGDGWDDVALLSADGLELQLLYSAGDGTLTAAAVLPCDGWAAASNADDAEPRGAALGRCLSRNGHSAL